MLKEKIDQFPKKPGVYLMKNDKGKIIYIGKAKLLKDRVKSYLNLKNDTRYQVQFLMKRVLDIDYLVCNTEKEALLLENSLIKKHRPRYNIFLRDDKSYLSLKLTTKHKFPRLIPTRKIKKDGSLYFGPYASAQACRETADFIYKYFQLRTCSDFEFKTRNRPCLEYQIKRCSAPCVHYVSQIEYAQQIKPIQMLLTGKNSDLIDWIKSQMNEASNNQQFEKAAELRDLLLSIQKTTEKQMVVQHGGHHQDLISLYREASKGIISVLNVRGGVLVDSHYYPVDSLEEDADLIENFLNQFYLETEFIPDEILINQAITDNKILTDILSEKKGKKVLIRQPQKGEKKDLLNLASQNAESQFIKRIKKEVRITEVLNTLKEKLHLNHHLNRIECYDISNISGEHATASMVVFTHGEVDKKEYRHFKIHLNEGPNDYAMMKEVLTRRFKNNHGWEMPDLIMLDGGKGQLNIGLEVLKELNLQISIIAVAKGQGQGVRAKGQYSGKKEEEIYLPFRKNPVLFKSGSAELKLLQLIRDESHRFAIKYHRKIRDKKMQTSFLDHIAGLGPAKKKALYLKFGSAKKIRETSKEELMTVKGITENLAEEILKA